jgi:hypothetical protein
VGWGGGGVGFALSAWRAAGAAARLAWVAGLGQASEPSEESSLEDESDELPSWQQPPW